MEILNNISQASLKEMITDKLLKPVQIIVLALNGGVLIFFLIGLSFYFTNQPFEHSGNIDTGLYDILLLALFVITISTYFMSGFVSDKILSGQNFQSQKPSEKGDESRSILSLITTYYILKLALLEAPALFGNVIFLLAASSKVIFLYDICWLSIVPMLIMFFISYQNFPTKQNVINLLMEKSQRFQEL